jgi:hypothetical protein
MSRVSEETIRPEGTAYRVTTLPPDVHPDAVADAVRRASGIRHDAVVPVVDLVRDGERWGVVEAPGDGSKPLDRVLRDTGALPPVEALHVARQLADGLAAAHAGGVVHGAITPANVWIRRGDHPRAALAGFATGAVSPPPAAYAPPERIGGDPADARGDVFALGLVLFEMLEGRPFVAGDVETIRATLLDGSGPLLPRFSHIPPAGVPALVARAIRRSPAQRQQTMAQVKSEIDACLVRLGEITIEAKSTPTRAPESLVRRRIVVVDDALAESAETPAPVAMPRPRARRSRGTRVALRLIAAGTGIAIGLALEWLIGGFPTAPVEAPRPAAVVAPQPEPEPPPPEEPVVAEPASVEPVPEVAPPVAAVPPEEPAPVAAPAPPALNAAPRIVSRRPRADRVDVTEGAAVDFDVRATDDPGDRLRYTWLLDGRPVARAPRWRFVAPSAASGTEHAVQVHVSDAAGLAAAPVAWTVTVAPRMTEADVSGWLERLAAAWERHDVATLRLYGLDDADVVRRGQRVSIVNERIRTEGPYATVAFDRAVRDPDGKIVTTGRASYELAKQPSGFVALR